MKKFLLTLLITLPLGGAGGGHAQNPYLPMWEYIPDGEPYVFEDPDEAGKYRVYIYGSHDVLRGEYCGRDQVAWSAPVENPTRWRFDGIIFRSTKNRDNKMLDSKGLSDVLYAPDVTLVTDKNGTKTYYLYPNNQAWGRNGMVARSARPDGPFEVCNWSKENPNANDGILGFDPAVFVDTDGRVYGYWGFERSMAAELDPTTMSTVKPGTQIVEDMISGKNQPGEFRFFEASSIRKIENKYVFVYSRWTKDGEFGLPESNYTLAYCWSDHPLGPWHYGGTLIDARAREVQPDGTTICTATPNGNTHGSICQVGQQWYVFYHRQCGTNEYSRQAMVAPIDVQVGSDGVKISEGEYTSEGFALEGLDPLATYPAGIACYYVGPTPAYAEYPNVVYSGPHMQPHYGDYYGRKEPYDAAINQCMVVHTTDGSALGYKYFNLSRVAGMKNLQLVMNIIPEGIDGTVEVWLDSPHKQRGGTRVGSSRVSSNWTDVPRTLTIDVPALAQHQGKHAIYLVFHSKTKGQSICKIQDIRFQN